MEFLKNFIESKLNHKVPNNFAISNNHGQVSKIAPRPNTDAVTRTPEPKFIPRYKGIVLLQPNRAEDDIIIIFEGPGVIILKKVRLIRLPKSVVLIIVFYILLN